ncbi:MAG: helix-turn-helix transcriptional regulator [Lachnospiraceae bacterium]|nr:helix-turn-helix transcriptional regulator [Lachnospiraceae bacterium]
MDYIIQKDGVTILIEEEKQRVRKDVIDQYVALRREKGLTQEDISQATGIARPNIARIESRKNTPTIEVLTKLACALDMELEIRFTEKRKAVS